MNAIDNLQKAMQRAESRPKVGGFPYLAECLRQAGAQRNLWTLPACQSVFITDKGNAVFQGKPLTEGFAEIPVFDQDELIRVLRADQAGQTSFEGFLEGSWRAGVIRYEVDFSKRTVVYYGALGERYLEEYPAVSVD